MNTLLPRIGVLLATTLALLVNTPRSLRAAPGDLDSLDANVVGIYVRATAVQPDGKTIIAGLFSSVLGQPRNNIARLNADGTLDTGFNPNTSGAVYSVAVQADGKILLGGAFTSVSGTARNYIARVAADGTLDASFNPDASDIVLSVAVQMDGKILLGGAFTSIGGTRRNNIARVASDGTLDTGFSPVVNGTVFSVAVQADGWVLLGGSFTSVSWTGRNYIARVASDGTLDPGFNPNANSSVNSVAVQADGQILLGGGFNSVSGTGRNCIARVASDGTLDLSFNPNANSSVNSVVVQADGQILLGGWFTTVSGTSRSRIARVTADGTLDTGFNPNASSIVHSVAVQADGKILLGGQFTTVGGTGRNRFARLLNDPATQTLSVPDTSVVTWTRGGSAPELSETTFELSTDGGTTYTPLAGTATRVGSTATWQLGALSLPASGQLRARGRTASGHYGGSSGLVEAVTSFSGLAPPAVTLTPPTPARGSTGGGTSITLTGTGFTGATAVTFGGVPAASVVVVNDTSITATTPAHAVGAVSVVVTTPSGSNAAYVPYTYVAPPTLTASSARLLTTATTLTITGTGFDAATPSNNSVVFTPAGSGIVTAATATSLTVTSLSGLTLGALNAVVTTNALDSGAAVQVATVVVPGPGDLDLLNANVVGSYVMATAVQPDGKTIIAGLFSSVLGQPRNNIARLNADGTLDTGFDPNANNIVYSVAVQVDGKILLGGNFTSVGGTGRNRIARVTADGTVDPGFNPNASSTVYSVAVQVDGKILFGGNFTSVGGAERNYSARVAADGTLDMGFSPAANSSIYSVVLQADGKILLGGYFSSVSGTGRNNIARVASDGTLDMGFNPNPNGYVNSVVVQADGKILLAGWFSSVGGTARSNIARVSADGTLDIGFNPDAGSFIYSVAVQADGKILLGGNFTSVGGAARNRIARVVADGTLDMGFNPNANNRIYSVAVQADGKILLGGLFTTVSGTGRNFFARMLNDPATQTLGVPDTSLVTWTRGGSAPEISQTTFELSTDGGTTYTSLAGTAIHVGSPATWQLAGLSLPTSGQLRARGRTLGGNYNGSSGLVEAVTSFSGLAPPAVSLTHLTPARGSTGGITSVTLTGTGFTGATAVTFGGTAATSVVVVNDTSITATTPAHAAGAVSVVVTTPSGSNAAYVPYTYVAPPTLTTSSARLLTTATTLTLNGTGFNAATPGNNSVIFTPAGSGTVTAATATSLTVTSLFGLTPGALNAVVTTNAIDSGAAVQVASVVVPGPGDLDPLNANVVGSYVMATAVQPDGKTIIAGSFSSVLGQPRNNIARLNADGTLDADFNPNANNIVYSVAVQADGKILLGGNFTSVGGVGRNRIAGVAANGTLDSGFNPNASGPVYCVAVQGDGKILLGGDFTSVGGVERNRIARVTADGTLDAVFNLNASGTVYSVVVQVDGKILLGGQFTSVGGTGRNNIARVAADGTLDTGFNPNASGPVYSVTVQMDGNILLGGQFTSVGGTARNSIAGVAVDGTLDLGFNPNASGAVYSVAVQVDGKILLGGSFTSVGGTGRNRIARVAADGTLDAGFNLNMGHISNNVFSVAVQADGQILLGGDFTTVGGTARRYFARLVNDPATQTLSAPDTTQVNWTRGGSAPEVSQVTFELSTDGGSSFTPLAGTATRVGNTVIWQLGALSLPTSGQLRARGRTVGGYYGGSSGLVEKVASFSSLMTPALTVTAITPNNGSAAGGTSVTITGTGFTGATGVMLGGTAATSFTVIDDTQITATSPAHAAGRASVLVSTPGGTNSANTLYTYISPPTVTASTADLITSATTVTITGTGFDAATPGNNSVVFTPEGSGTVTAATGTSLTVTSLSGLTLGALNAVVTTNGLSSGAAVQVATVVVPPPGTLDSLDANVVGSSATVYATAVQPDGKTIIAGSFSSVLGQPRNNIARLNADGTLDAAFNPNANNTVYSLAVQADGQILLGGNFTSLGGAGRNRIARVAADGTLDTSFNPNASGTVYCVAIQADGKILLGGNFTTVSGAVRNNIARVAANGMLDTGFNPNANSAVYCVALQSDGKILLGGHFTTVGGIARNRIARVAANGTPDTGFYPNPYGRISSVAVQADGKILLAGYFTSVGGTARNSIARVAANGTLDASFNPDVSGGGSDVNSVAVQADGKILLGGNFTTVGGVGRNNIARVAADGTLDTGFNPNASSTVSSVAVQADGKILLGGNFTSVGGTGRNLFARLLNDPVTQTLSVSSATQVTWTRGGSAPDVSQVTFEVSTDGGTSYTPLGGTATRVGSTPNWQLTGLSLPSSGQLRALGRTTNGYQNGSSGLVEQVQAFVFPPEMVVSGNSVEITGGDSMPSVDDHTDFGNVNVVGGSLVRSFTIANSGGGTVNLTGTPKVAISGTNAADFSVNVQPTTPVAAGGGTTFQVTFVPSAVGLRSATLSIANDDSDENPYDFSIQGTGDTFGGNLAFAPVGYTVTEGGMATLTINRSESASGEVAVTVATSTLTVAPSALATVIKDYTAKVQVLTFANGESSKTFDVLTQTDALVEPNETFLVNLSAPANGAVLGSATTARVTIIDPSATLPTDITLPAITLTTPASNALVGVNTGGSMNLIGTATDGKGVKQVEYRVVPSGGLLGAFTLATLGTPGSNSTSFTAPITPVTGTNMVEVKVTDYKGNTRSLARTFKVTRPLQVILAGTGTVSTGFAGTSFREVGKPLTITATPGMGHVFDGWLVSNTAGSGITPLMLELPKLTFTFTERLVLTAKFIPNPFTTSLVGTFNGLALPSGATTPGVANVGLLSNLVLDTKGSFTGSLKIDGVSLSTPGFFDNAGVACFSVTTRVRTLLFKRTGKPDIELALNLNMIPGSGKLSGTVTQKIGAAVQAVSNIDADRAHYSTANKVPANLAGTTTKPYTLVFPAKTQSPVKPLNLYPQGDGYATMTVNVNGTVSLTGRLADDTPIIASAPLSKLNIWPLFAQLYTLKGSIAGMAALSDANGTTEDLIGTNLQWFRPALTGVQYYPAGWSGGITVDVNGARYVVPPASSATSVFPGLGAVNTTTGNATLTFTGGLLTSSVTKDFNISATNVISKLGSPVDATYGLVLIPVTGVIGGAVTTFFTHSDLTKPTYKGVVIQKGSKQGGRGFFLSRITPVTGLGESGKVHVLAK